MAIGAEDLHGHGPAEPPIEDAAHLAEPAAAEEPDILVAIRQRRPALSRHLARAGVVVDRDRGGPLAQNLDAGRGRRPLHRRRVTAFGHAAARA
ncbi:MAG: hypothetical protein QM820_20155 [Minicystis sp.]